MSGSLATERFAMSVGSPRERYLGLVEVGRKEKPTNRGHFCGPLKFSALRMGGRTLTLEAGKFPTFDKFRNF